ncbi:hypothetical protein [Paenibacillus ehimensis]|uniref:Uncharacterized protein n=1 Tax=Paenibacillus ehimensis TaxID=79264 RepID=A0ABT8VJH2_9BACL|nr:hypothetical protein [Paenibacillus ehimensis]MDO3681137.1 hypothetical protein [Paenibacillus ehimensis]MEC0212501.1 hypothetical protein [Paenibacillus ehimensis]
MEWSLDLALLLAIGLASLFVVPWFGWAGKRLALAFEPAAELAKLPLKRHDRARKSPRTVFVRRKCPPRSSALSEEANAPFRWNEMVG